MAKGNNARRKEKKKPKKPARPNEFGHSGGEKKK
jgi:hypothetical protein